MSDKREVYRKWHEENKNNFEYCAKEVRRLIEKILESEKATYHSITSRVKTEDSFLKKCESGKYSDPTNEIHADFFAEQAKKPHVV